MNMVDRQYLILMREILNVGVYRDGRNGGTHALFGAQMRFDLQAGFPLLTTKKVFFKGVLTELLWFLRGDTNVRWLQERGVKIWDAWANEEGDLGPVYGSQWRNWPGQLGGYIDQIEDLIVRLQEDPFSRRHVVTAWNPADLGNMALPPCHCLFQFNVRPGTHDGEERLFLDCQLYQRSADWFLGVPFNIASYALLTHLVAFKCGMVPGTFVHSFGDLHLYENHRGQALNQILREPRALPTLRIAGSPGLDMSELESLDIRLEGYDPHPAIKAEVSV